MEGNAMGGQAFPRGGDQYGHGGMTLRDYFAAQALPAIISERHRSLEHEASTWALCACIAYQVADAMIKERSR
jgi:hypothetical protein